MLFLSFVTEEIAMSVDRRQKLNNLLQNMTNNRIKYNSWLKTMAHTKLLNITKTSIYQKSYSHSRIRHT